MDAPQVLRRGRLESNDVAINVFVSGIGIFNENAIERVRRTGFFRGDGAKTDAEKFERTLLANQVEIEFVCDREKNFKSDASAASKISFPTTTESKAGRRIVMKLTCPFDENDTIIEFESLANQALMARSMSPEKRTQFIQGVNIAASACFGVAGSVSTECASTKRYVELLITGQLQKAIEQTPKYCSTELELGVTKRADVVSKSAAEFEIFMKDDPLVGLDLKKPLKDLSQKEREELLNKYLYSFCVHNFFDGPPPSHCEAYWDRIRASLRRNAGIAFSDKGPISTSGKVLLRDRVSNDKDTVADLFAYDIANKDYLGSVEKAKAELAKGNNPVGTFLDWSNIAAGSSFQNASINYSEKGYSTTTSGDPTYCGRDLECHKRYLVFQQRIQEALRNGTARPSAPGCYAVRNLGADSEGNPVIELAPNPGGCNGG